MMNKKKYSVFLRLLFVAIGFISLVKMIKHYGLHNLTREIEQTRFLLFILVLTFIPTLTCYSLSWLLATDHKQMDNVSSLKKMFLFIKFTIISVAWNNLTPFIKVGGEPLKYFMLLKYLPGKTALSSTINYNIIHFMATILSFFITALTIMIFYQMSDAVHYSLIGITLIFALIFYMGYWLNRADFFKKNLHRWVKKALVVCKTILRQLVRFYQENPKRFYLSLTLDTSARFFEGLTFYTGFLIIKYPIKFLSSVLLDVGRTFIDTVFFFIPYQLGSREQGVHFFMEKILMINSSGFLTAVFLYRFVEIFWIFMGYLFWASSNNSSKEVTM